MPIVKCHIDRRAIEKAIKQQRELSQKITLVDPSGLRLAVNARSTSWNYNYRKRGVDYYGKRHPQRTLRLGDPLTMTVQEARLRVEEIKAEVRNGGDPALSLQQALVEQRQHEYQQRPLRVWLEEYQHRALGNNTKYRREELMHATSALQELGLYNSPPSNLTARAVRQISVTHCDRPSTARHRFGALSRFIDFLVDEEVIERNPVKDISRRHRPKASAAREKYFSTLELQRLWNPRGPLRDDYLRFLRFMIVCPLRMSEAAELRRRNLDLNRRELLLSADETKNNESFTLPLPGLALQILQPMSEKGRSRCFQLSSIDGAPMKSWSFFNKAVRRTSGIEQFNLHDLRRTFTTLLSEHSEFTESLIDSLLNHKRSSTRTGVMRSYQHAKNLKQRRDIMDWWAEFLEREIINDRKI